MFLKRRKILRPVWGLCLAAVFLADALLGFSAARADEPSGTGGTEWNLAMIGADTASSLGFRGQNVRIGVIDSGVSPHPAFADRLVGGHNYVADAPDPEDTSDAYGHGTRVAGLIAAVAPEAEIVPLKITDSGSVSTSLLCEAIYGGIDEFGCDVLNLSLGVPYDRESLRQAVAYAAKKGVVVVAATGNDGTGEIYYPAAYDSVIGVSAVESSGAVSVRSNSNESVSIAAPGVQVRTASHRGGFVTESGCSYAVPHVSAAAAILFCADPGLSADDVLRLLTGCAADRGLTGYDEHYGYGILDIAGCLEALAEEGTDPGAPPVSYADCPRDGSCPLAGFTDLDRSAWYHDGIHFALENGLMNGAEGRNFVPDAPTSRAMIVTILWRLAGKPAAASDPKFADVPPGIWYADAVRWAASEGIVGGYGGALFGPDDPVSREQLAAILYRYAVSRGADPGSGSGDIPDRFADAEEVSPWAAEAMGGAVDSGLIGGISGGRLGPGLTAGRAQTATIFMRLARMIE